MMVTAHEAALWDDIAFVACYPFKNCYGKDPGDNSAEFFLSEQCPGSAGSAKTKRHDMIKHYYWPTPNGHKTAIMLEEVGIDYEVIPVDILMQWLMVQMGNVGPMFGQNGYFQGYCPEDVPLAKERYHNVTKHIYSVLDKRLDDAAYLAGDRYSIADVATYPWTMPKQKAMHKIEADAYPNVKRWGEEIAARPAVQRGVSVLSGDMKVGNPTAETYKNMFGNGQFERNGK
jgi:hypothetical protein